MTIKTEFSQGRWLVNNKRMEELNQDERIFMNAFFREIKEELNLLKASA
jgi:hypothetical protein